MDTTCVHEQTVAVAIDPEDAYNRVQFKLLIDLPMQYGVSITLTRWIARALLKRIVVMQLGNKALLLISSQWAYHKVHRSRHLLNNNNVHLSCAHQHPERSHDTY